MVIACIKRTVLPDLLANVLGIEHLVADSTLEASQVPVLVQRYKRLLVLKLLPTAAAV